MLPFPKIVTCAVKFPFSFGFVVGEFMAHLSASLPEDSPRSDSEYVRGNSTQVLRKTHKPEASLAQFGQRGFDSLRCAAARPIHMRQDDRTWRAG